MKKHIYLITLTPAGSFCFGTDTTSAQGNGCEGLSGSLVMPQQTALLKMLRFYLLSNDCECYDSDEMRITDPENAALLVGIHSFDMNSDDNYGIIECLSPCFIQVSADNGGWQTLVPAGFDRGIGTTPGNTPVEQGNNGGMERGFTTEDGKEFFSYCDIFETEDTSVNKESCSRPCFRFRTREREKDGKKAEALRSLRFRFAFTATMKNDWIEDIDSSSDMVTLDTSGSAFFLDIESCKTTLPQPKPEDGEELKVTLLSDSFIPEEALQLAKHSISETVLYRYTGTTVEKTSSESKSVRINRAESEVRLYARGSVFFFETPDDRQKFTRALDIRKFTTIGCNMYR